MLAAAASIPKQIESAVLAVPSEAESLDTSEIRSILVLGMGTSGMVGDILSAVVAPTCSVPMLVSKHPETLKHVNNSTLVLAISFSGDTSETLEVATLAAGNGGQMISITTGGKLAEDFSEWTVPLLTPDFQIPNSRSGLAVMSAAAITLLAKLGLARGLDDTLLETAEHLKSRRDELLDPEPFVKTLAGKLDRTIPIIYGAGGIGSVAARRFKTQINENAKAPAFAGSLPELWHNEMVGWGQHGDMTRQVTSAVLLRHDYEHPSVASSFVPMRDILAEVTSEVHELHAQGNSPVTQLFDLIMIADFVSLHMAAIAGVDPGPSEVIDDIRKQFATS